MKFKITKVKGVTMTQKEWARQANQSMKIAQAMIAAGQRLFGTGTVITEDDRKFLEKATKRKKK